MRRVVTVGKLARKWSRATLIALPMIALSASAASIQVRTFDPLRHKYIAGFGANSWNFPHTDLICGIQLPADADCWGRFEAYVREATPGGKAICAALMTAKIQQTAVTYHLDVTNSAQCEIVRVEQ